jgi:hypothetical protein
VSEPHQVFNRLNDIEEEYLQRAIFNIVRLLNDEEPEYRYKIPQLFNPDVPFYWWGMDMMYICSTKQVTKLFFDERLGLQNEEIPTDKMITGLQKYRQEVRSIKPRMVNHNFGSLARLLKNVNINIERIKKYFMVTEQKKYKSDSLNYSFFSSYPDTFFSPNDKLIGMLHHHIMVEPPFSRLSAFMWINENGIKCIYDELTILLNSDITEEYCWSNDNNSMQLHCSKEITNASFDANQDSEIKVSTKDILQLLEHFLAYIDDRRNMPIYIERDKTEFTYFLEKGISYLTHGVVQWKILSE